MASRSAQLGTTSAIRPADLATVAEQLATQQLLRDQAQFEAGGIPRAQLDDSRANQAIKLARVRELNNQLEIQRLPAREDQIRAQNAQGAAARAAQSQAAWRLDQKRVFATQGGLVSDTLYRDGERVPAGRPVVAHAAPAQPQAALLRPRSRSSPKSRLAAWCVWDATAAATTSRQKSALSPVAPSSRRRWLLR